MKYFLTTLFLTLIISTFSFAETIVLTNFTVIKGSVEEYKKNSISFFNEDQTSVLEIEKSKILYLAFDSENPEILAKIESKIAGLADINFFGKEVLVLSDGALKKGKISQYSHASLLIDSGGINIEEIPRSDFFGIYFVQNKSYYSKTEKKQNAETTLAIKKDSSRLKGILKEIKNDSIVFSQNNKEIEILKKDLNWILFQENPSALKQKAEKEFDSSYRFIAGKELLVMKNGSLQKITLTKIEQEKLFFISENLSFFNEINGIYGIYFGPIPIKDPVKDKKLHSSDENEEKETEYIPRKKTRQ